MSDPFKDFLEELERRRGNGTSEAADSDPAVDAPPPRTRARRPGGATRGPRPTFRFGLRAIFLSLILVLVVVGGPLIGLLTDARWFASLGASAIFWQRLQLQGSLFVGGTLAALALLLLSLVAAGLIARRFSSEPTNSGTPREPRTPLMDDRGNLRPEGIVDSLRGLLGADGDGTARSAGATIGNGALRIGAVVIALLIGAQVAANWQQIALWQNAVPYAADGSAVDPIFGRDISFYLFSLPVLRLAQGLGILLLASATALAALRYLPAIGARGLGGVGTLPRLHLALLIGGLLLVTAYGYQLDKLDLVYSQNGVATGVSYTDATARIPGLDALTVIAALAAAFLVGAAVTRSTWPLVLTATVWFGASAVLTGIYPEFVQRFQVTPNEFALEQPYIANNIRMTRLAFGLDGWTERQYDGSAELTTTAIADNSSSFADARLWDYRPLQATLDQLQTVRQYYNFSDVDVDRYVIDGKQRLVMLSARELNPQRALQSATWVNRRIAFTHGIGVAMVPVAGVASGGLPQLIIRDIPPVSTGGAPVVSQPRIYFGELDDDWVIVGAKTDEFDYPVGNDASGSGASGDATTKWSGTSGISLNTFFDRLLFAARLGDLNLLISDLSHRSVPGTPIHTSSYELMGG